MKTKVCRRGALRGKQNSCFYCFRVMLTRRFTYSHKPYIHIHLQLHKSIPKLHQVHPVEHRRDLQLSAGSSSFASIRRSQPSSPPHLSCKASSSWDGLKVMKSLTLSVRRAQFSRQTGRTWRKKLSACIQKSASL